MFNESATQNWNDKPKSIPIDIFHQLIELSKGKINNFCEVCGETETEEEIKICRDCWNHLEIKG